MRLLKRKKKPIQQVRDGMKPLQGRGGALIPGGGGPKTSKQRHMIWLFWIWWSMMLQSDPACQLTSHARGWRPYARGRHPHWSSSPRTWRHPHWRTHWGAHARGWTHHTCKQGSQVTLRTQSQPTGGWMLSVSHRRHSRTGLSVGHFSYSYLEVGLPDPLGVGLLVQVDTVWGPRQCLRLQLLLQLFLCPAGSSPETHTHNAVVTTWTHTPDHRGDAAAIVTCCEGPPTPLTGPASPAGAWGIGAPAGTPRPAARPTPGPPATPANGTRAIPVWTPDKSSSTYIFKNHDLKNHIWLRHLCCAVTWLQVTLTSFGGGPSTVMETRFSPLSRTRPSTLFSSRSGCFEFFGLRKGQNDRHYHTLIRFAQYYPYLDCPPALCENICW